MVHIKVLGDAPNYQEEGIIHNSQRKPVCDNWDDVWLWNMSRHESTDNIATD